MEALDFIILGAGVWAAVIALAMTLLIAASRADEATGELSGASKQVRAPRERAVPVPRLGAMAPSRVDGRRTAGLA